MADCKVHCQEVRTSYKPQDLSREPVWSECNVAHCYITHCTCRQWLGLCLSYVVSRSPSGRRPLIAGIAGLNPAKGMGVSLLCR
jgi:hypothetical protein